MESIAAELRSRHEVDAIALAADLSEAADVSRVIDFMSGKEISIIVNSAGIASFGKFMDQDWDYETRQFDLNAKAVHRLTRAALEQMLPRRNGAICNVGSAAGNVSIPNNATYVFTKAGVNAFTEALHYELKPAGVNCTLLAPGPVREARKEGEDLTEVDDAVPDFLWTTYEDCALDTLDGLDSLLSIVQMPAGVPTATVSIDGAKNAGLLAVRTLAVGSEQLMEQMVRYQEAMRDQVFEKDRALKYKLMGGE